MRKEIKLSFDDPNMFLSVIDSSGSLVKTASNISSEITKFIANLKPDTKRYVYALVYAMGASEFYGPNNNGDAFPEYYEGKKNLIADGPDFGYKTFQTNAVLYRHHRNGDPRKKFGDILLAVYNFEMHRPELVIRVDRQKAPEEASKIDRGEIVSTSMGAKVPFDVCSVCGNKAKTRRDYCVHLRKYMNKVLPDGTKVYAINPRPKFFDMSMVFKPADRISGAIKKLASDTAAKVALASHSKAAEISKRIPGARIGKRGAEKIIDRLISGKFSAMERKLPNLSNDCIDDMCSSGPLRGILSSMLFGGIIPKRREFQRIVLIKMNKRPLADMLDQNNIVFEDSDHPFDSNIGSSLNISAGNLSDRIASILRPQMSLRSRLQPFLLRRLLGPGQGQCPGGPSPTRLNINKSQNAISSMYRAMRSIAPFPVIRALKGSIGLSDMSRDMTGRGFSRDSLMGNIPSSKVIIMIKRASDASDGVARDASESRMMNAIGDTVSLSAKTASKLYSFYDIIYGDTHRDRIGYHGSDVDGLLKTAYDGIMGAPMMSLIADSNMATFSDMDKLGSDIDMTSLTGAQLELIGMVAGEHSEGIDKMASMCGGFNFDSAGVLYDNSDILDRMTFAKMETF